MTEESCPLCDAEHWRQAQEAPDNVVPLGMVPRLKAEDKCRAEVIGHLERLLRVAQEGEIDCIMILAAHPDGTYSEAMSSTTQFRQMIGQMEVVKQNWIGLYLASLQGKPIGGK